MRKRSKIVIMQNHLSEQPVRWGGVYSQTGMTGHPGLAQLGVSQYELLREFSLLELKGLGFFCSCVGF